MEPIEREATKASVDYVADNLYNVNLLFPKLISKSLIGNDDQDHITKVTTRRMQVTELINILHGKEDAFFALLEILIAEKKKHVAKRIYDEYKRLGGTTEVNIDEAEKILQQLGWKATSSAFKFSLLMPPDQNLADVSTWPTVKKMYLKRFHKTNPFSLPFTFDIDKTWVSLKLIEDSEDSQATEDYAELLKRALLKEDMLIIEGKAATGKTCLMRRMAYDWAKGQKDLSHFDLVAYAEFREVRGQEFETIADLVIQYNKKCKKFIDSKELEDLQSLLSSNNYCEERKKRVLLLLDGYDESSLEKQCKELKTYFSSDVIQNPLLFNIVLTSRPGYLSKHRGNQGRFVFADVLGFTTKEQKEKYISQHFFPENKNREKIAAVRYLVEKNKNLDKLAETPLFLTFICLVHKEIVYGTILELYCNIIRWLIDRHQKAFPDRDIPALFEYQSDSDDRFRTIQDNCLQFPHLHSLGKMALAKLEDDIFQLSEIKHFNLKPILEQVGLLRKDEFYKSLRLTTTFSFPHRTLKELLAALYYFVSDENTDKWFSINTEMDIYKINEYERFLLRVALSKQFVTLPMHIPINATKYELYFEPMKRITSLTLDTTFDAFNTTAGLNNELLNWFISQCTNLQILKLNFSGKQIPIAHKFTFCNLIHLHSLIFLTCIFEANSQIFFINCPSLKYLEFTQCEIESTASIEFSKLPALDTMKFWRCALDLQAWQSITDEITRSFVKKLNLEFATYICNEVLNHLQKCNSVKKIEINILAYKSSKDYDPLSVNDLINLHSLTFESFTFEANFLVSFTNCPSLKCLGFKGCELKSCVSIDFSKLPALDTFTFIYSTIGLKEWQLITDDITRNSVKNLKLSPDFFEGKENSELVIHLQKYECIEKIELYIAIAIGFHEERLTTNLSKFAREMKGLKRIVFYSEGKRMKYTNMEIIEKAGQERDPDFKIFLKFPSDFFTKKDDLEHFIHLQKCDWIEKIEVYDAPGMSNEEQLTTNLSNLAREMKGLKTIIFDDLGKRMEENNMEIIREAGRERYPDFRVIFGKETDGDCNAHGRNKEIEIKQEESRKRKRQSSS